MNTQVLQEVKSAYADCWMTDARDGMQTRNLSFRASEAVSPADAVEIARQAIRGYNAFEPELLSTFPADCEITFAREGSVCVYVKPGATPLPGPSQLSADEYDIENGLVRIWWD